MLYLNVVPIFVARGIQNVSTYLIKAGFSPHSAHFILHSKTRSIRLDHIEKLCKLLICEPSDLFAWQPDKDENIPNTHPITRLKKNGVEESINNLIADVPFKQIVEIAAIIKEKKEEALSAKTKKEA
ncbi:helix-turn-helix transcriptional regulator [Pedobacter miscanthi]|jgi:DNA-binding Xre family transcriptional regulator|uniref:helix-turn-helix domain-containing protein n=1 Tax=Pedobacter miscanthi TaxID=2259170 RepID=UPI00292F9D5B|nr:helix-turn-helix transcriptional regulator [Pedobacter miscanthi]